jgi:hypothetical protein
MTSGDVLVARYAFQLENRIGENQLGKKQNIVQPKPYCQETRTRPLNS